MYKLSLKDLGPNRVSMEIHLEASTIQVAVIEALVICKVVLNRPNLEWMSAGDNEYVVNQYNIPVGSFTLTKVD